MSKKTQYPLYFRQTEWFYVCLLNEEESIQVGLYGHSNSIQHNFDNNGTWVHKNWAQDIENYLPITKSEFNKAYKKAMKILQEKFKS